MRCRDIERLSSVYIDGELDNDRASALRGHLHQCKPCQLLIADAADVRDACQDLAGMDQPEPPQHLWSHIQRDVARAEMADAERSRIWLWWQRARQHMLPAAVACAAVVLVVAWMSRRDERPLEAVADRATPTVALDTAVSGKTKNMVATQSFTESRIDEIDRADARYVAVINELKKSVANMRVGWAATMATQFDAAFARLERAADAQRSQVGPPETDPSKRDALYAVYQQQIDLLQGAAFGELRQDKVRR